MVPCSDARPGAAGALLVALLVDVLATLINLVAVAPTCGFSFRFSDWVLRLPVSARPDSGTCL